jgi:hypothetical protein
MIKNPLINKFSVRTPSIKLATPTAKTQAAAPQKSEISKASSAPIGSVLFGTTSPGPGTYSPKDFNQFQNKASAFDPATLNTKIDILQSTGGNPLLNGSVGDGPAGQGLGPNLGGNGDQGLGLGLPGTNPTDFGLPGSNAGSDFGLKLGSPAGNGEAPEGAPNGSIGGFAGGNPLANGQGNAPSPGGVGVETKAYDNTDSSGNQSVGETQTTTFPDGTKIVDTQTHESDGNGGSKETQTITKVNPDGSTEVLHESTSESDADGNETTTNNESGSSDSTTDTSSSSETTGTSGSDGSDTETTPSADTGAGSDATLPAGGPPVPDGLGPTPLAWTPPTTRPMHQVSNPSPVEQQPSFVDEISLYNQAEGLGGDGAENSAPRQSWQPTGNGIVDPRQVNPAL